MEENKTTDPQPEEASEPVIEPEANIPAPEEAAPPKPVVMETHAHHLHKAPGKKGWHYFFEFFMLFLAVFCGFLAENLREHIIEKHRAKEYMKEIVENLKYDIVRCDNNIGINIAFSRGLDSLRAELRNAVRGTINSNRLYYFSLQYPGRLSQAVFNRSAMTELKNSGSLRLIDNKELVTELADYYERKVYAADQNIPTKEEVDALQNESNAFFSLMDLDDYTASYDRIGEANYDNNYDYQNILSHQPTLKLLNNDPKELEKYYTLVSQYEIKVKSYNFWLEIVKKTAEKLIADIKKEYHL